MTTDLPIWRSLLYVPVNVERYVVKAHARGADGIILDLEDSIAPADKQAARGHVADAAARVGQSGADVLVRVNRPLELAVHDIDAAVSAGAAALLLPKIDSDSHVRLLAEVAHSAEIRAGRPAGSTRFAVMVETAEAFPRLFAIAAAHPRNVAVTLGGEDFALATGSLPDPDVLLYPKQQVVLAASAAGILPIGLIGTVADYRDHEAVLAAIARSRRFGFVGSACIHPAIVPLLNDGFTPGDAECAGAQRIVTAFEAAKAEGRGSAEVDGKMIDIPVVERAERLLRHAQRIEERRRTAPEDIAP
ncbi:HpcH/HpaI aldolase/citrate lyase family protein [Marinivivus vitaminiproducens]|uniref:HpcH/HpaI aldolase/citrate lyase family protein n=1 Tax=Marinivivus vitaminiproducens TaxID=3035935 RepID=UPI0027A53849|nr:CoA ester lyase [Geminicoccaceae bacterium SCSIO 64248]